MSKILIFTNWDSWLKIADVIKGTKWVEDSYPDGDHPIVRCECETKEPAKLSFAENCKEEGVYLIFDEIDESTFGLLKDQCKTGEVIILKHDHTPIEITSVFSDLRNKVNPTIIIKENARHEKQEQYLYRPVFETLNSADDNKIDLILKRLRPTDKEKLKETVLRFLMGSLKPNNTEKSFLTAYKDLCGQTSIGNDVKMFYEKSYKEKKSLNEYKDELTKLRDKLIAFSSK